MIQSEQIKAAKSFVERWTGHGYEKGESQKFWIDLLTSLFEVRNIAQFIFFEEQVKEKIAVSESVENNKKKGDSDKLNHHLQTITNFIDAYIPSTRVMIEQKSSNKNLREPIKQSDGSSLTPFQQAKKYVADLPLSQHPKWIVTCNFNEFLVYDMENPSGEPEQIFLKDLPKDFYRLQFLVDQKSEKIRREEEISIEAGKLVDKLYEALLPQYKPNCESREANTPVSEYQSRKMLKQNDRTNTSGQVQYDGLSEKQLRSLNILCVRIVFCLYAEDAGLFVTRTAFEDYIKGFNLPNVRMGLKNLFKALDTKIADRDEYDESLKPFPYVNGGLFKDENIEIPNFTQEIIDVIVNDCAAFNWSEISPTIFGAVFESTLNPETRRKGGMHYTSIQNIHKVIDPLFMDELNAEFEGICNGSVIEPVASKMFSTSSNTTQHSKKLSARERPAALEAFQTKLASLRFLDPACGSGNFLTETYLSLRRLENKVISALYNGGKVLGFDEFIKVKINQFYGIEINDFAVTVAKTALWIAESQMVAETEAILSQTIDFLPLTTNAFIVEGNALRMNWSTLRSEDTENRNELPLFQFTAPPDSSLLSSHSYDYIMGNPPFVGARLMSESQKSDVSLIWQNAKNLGNLDYVSCWYKKAADFIKGTDTKAALVSTNSITQGEQVALMWKPLFENDGVQIDFAWRTFRWDSESTEKAHVHCVILGFSGGDRSEKVGNRNKEGGDRNGTELRGFDSLAEGNGFDSGNLQVNEATAKRRTVFAAGSNEKSGRVDSFKYSGRLRTEESERISSIPADSTRFGNGTGNSVENLPTNKLSDIGTGKNSSQSLAGNSKNNSNSPKKLTTKSSSLTSNSSSLSPVSTHKRIYNPDGTFTEAANINGYLLDAPDVFVESRSKPLCAVPEIGIGNKPIDGGNYLFTEDGMREFIKKEPASEKYFHKWIGSDEFINRYYRYCLWLGDCSPSEIKKMPECYKRVQAVRETRLSSTSKPTQKLADTPTHFHVENMPKSDYIVVPKVSSEKRFYIPIGFLTPDIFASDLVFIIPDASLYHFGILTSSVHMAWMRAVAGRLETRYRYSKDIVYNNFPWPVLGEKGGDRNEKGGVRSEEGGVRRQDLDTNSYFLTPNSYKQRIEQTAQAILDARAKYPDSSLADLYDETLMPQDLRRAHRENDKAVMQAYGFKPSMTESEIVAELFKLYERFTKS